MIAKDPQNKKILITREGLKQLKQELEHLTTVARKEVADRLNEAISYGDLSENSEYVEAKDQQAFIEGRILELEEQIKSAQIINEVSGDKDTVQIGSTVILKFQNSKHTYTIVGSTEADPLAQKISNESPVGSAILGKKIKENVKVTAPGGSFEYQILEIK